MFVEAINIELSQRLPDGKKFEQPLECLLILTNTLFEICNEHKIKALKKEGSTRFDVVCSDLARLWERAVGRRLRGDLSFSSGRMRDYKGDKLKELSSPGAQFVFVVARAISDNGLDASQIQTSLAKLRRR